MESLWTQLFTLERNPERVWGATHSGPGQRSWSRSRCWADMIAFFKYEDGRRGRRMEIWQFDSVSYHFDGRHLPGCPKGCDDGGGR